MRPGPDGDSAAAGRSFLPLSCNDSTDDQALLFPPHPSGDRAAGRDPVADLGRPVVLNTLRFPLNVIRTFGRAWSSITREPIPLVALNGAVVGMIDNAKIGTARLFDFIEEILRGEYGVRECIRRRKPDASRPVPTPMLMEMRAADAILAAIGD